MDKDTFTLNNQTYSNNNNILLGIINELQQISNSSHENLTIKRISDVIIKMNFIINENRKTRELIMNQFTILQNQISQLNQKLNINKYIYGTHRKLETMQKFAEEEGLTLDEIAFIGDEINDVKLLSSCGLGFAVADADFHVQKVAHIVCKKEGGKGGGCGRAEQHSRNDRGILSDFCVHKRIEPLVLNVPADLPCNSQSPHKQP